MKNYFESIWFFNTIGFIGFSIKFVDINSNNNETYQLKAKFLKAGISSGNDVKMRGQGWCC